MSDYYTVTGSPANRSSLSSAVIRSEFASLAAGFAKVAPYTGHSGEIVRVNAGGTGQESVSFASLLLTNIVIAGSLSGVTSLSMAGALSGVTNLSMAGTITGTTDMTMSGTLNGVNIVTTGNTTLGNAVGDTLNVAGGSLQVSAAGSVGIGGAPVQKFDVFNGHIKITDGFSFLWGDSSTKLVGNSTTDVFSIYTNTTERVTIDASGNVGVGSSPLFTAANRTALSVSGVASSVLGLGVGSTGYASIYADSGTTSYSHNTGTIQLATAGNTRVTIDASGNVGVGGTPTSKLHVLGNTTTVSTVASTGTGTSDFSDHTVVGNDVTARLTAYGTNHTVRGGSVWLNANTASTLVLATANTSRFTISATGAGNFGGTLTAGAFSGPLTGNVTGNAATATALQTARNINGVAFDGTANISVNLNNALTAGSGLTSAGTFDGSAARTFAVDSTSANTASKIVARDASGNFAAGTITATLSGNASTATALNNALTAGSFLTSSGTFDGSAARTFAVDATSANTASKVVARDASGNFSAGTITAALSGNASTATALQTARTINGTSFDGTGNITVAAAAATLTGTTLPALDGGALTNLNASNLASGTVGTARLGSGTANSTKYLRGDSTWQDAPLSGTYTPTLTGVSNVAGSTAYVCQYMRVGNVVSVSGKVSIDPTNTSTQTELGISLPIASALTAEEQLGGTAGTGVGASAPQIAMIRADATNDRATLLFQTATDVNNNPWSFHFTYLVQ